MTGRDNLIIFLTYTQMGDGVPLADMIPITKKTLELYEAERSGDLNLSHEAFNSDCRARAELGILWDPWIKTSERLEHLLDCIEYAIVMHRIKVHGEIERQKRADELAELIDAVDPNIRAVLGFWN